MRIYLSGKRKDWNAAEWLRVESILHQFGHTVASPNLINPDKELSWIFNMSTISSCDAIAMLDGWETCKACKLESAWADYIDIQCSGWRDYVEVVA